MICFHDSGRMNKIKAADSGAVERLLTAEQYSEQTGE